MEFCNFLYHLQQAHFSTVKPIIIVTENNREDWRGDCVSPCVRARWKINDVFMRTCDTLLEILLCVCTPHTELTNTSGQLSQIWVLAPPLLYIFPHNAAAHIRASWPDDITSSSSCNNTVTCVKAAFTLPITDTRTPWTSAPHKDSKSWKKTAHKHPHPLIRWPGAVVKKRWKNFIWTLQYLTDSARLHYSSFICTVLCL